MLGHHMLVLPGEGLICCTAPNTYSKCIIRPASVEMMLADSRKQFPVQLDVVSGFQNEG